MACIVASCPGAAGGGASELELCPKCLIRCACVQNQGTGSDLACVGQVSQQCKRAKRPLSACFTGDSASKAPCSIAEAHGRRKE